MPWSRRPPGKKLSGILGCSLSHNVLWTLFLFACLFLFFPHLLSSLVSSTGPFHMCCGFQFSFFMGFLSVRTSRSLCLCLYLTAFLGPLSFCLFVCILYYSDFFVFNLVVFYFIIYYPLYACLLSKERQKRWIWMRLEVGRRNRRGSHNSYIVWKKYFQ